jgi:hypothetical protein
MEFTLQHEGVKAAYFSAVKSGGSQLSSSGR